MEKKKVPETASQTNTENKLQTVPEGIDKAEARAKRKEAKKQNKNPKKDASKIDESKSKNEINLHQENNIIENKNEIVESKNKAGGELSKAELRAQRRAIQEAQRQAKAAGKIKQENQKVETKPTQTNENKTKKVLEPPKVNKIIRDPRKESISIVTGGNLNKQVQLFNHLYLHQSLSITKDDIVSNLHSSIIRLGVRFMSLQILGSNARCLALLSAIKDVLKDFRTPPQQEFCRSFEANLQASTNYLQRCRPLAVSMTNAIRNIKWHLTQMPPNLSDDEKKGLLGEGIDTYINDEIGMADKAISMTVQAKIYPGDVILTYGCSSIITKILLDAHKSGKNFSVIVVDARPLLEGREILRMLVNAGINCSYVFINAASFIMGQVTKVLLGAHSLLANGYVMSRAGTAQVALIAQAFNKPVLVCCETYKFCERVQTDSIVHNEIGDPDKLVFSSTFEGKGPLENWKESKYVTPLNLMYDITPPDLVTAVVTELAILPCTSVPVILRIKPTELAL